MTVVKLAALLVAASCGFRGGRIFPSVFVGTALGLCAHALVPEVHPAVGVSAGVLGLLLAVTRQGWVSLFVAAVLVASPACSPCCAWPPSPPGCSSPAARTCSCGRTGRPSGDPAPPAARPGPPDPLRRTHATAPWLTYR